jgi:hypothetical protein
MNTLFLAIGCLVSSYKQPLLILSFSCAPLPSSLFFPLSLLQHTKEGGQEIRISIRYWNKLICSSSSAFYLVIRITFVRRSSSPILVQSGR